MIAMTIGTVFVLIIASFTVDLVRSSLRTQNKAQNDLTEWGIYQGITVDTRTANGMTLYKTFSNSADFADVTMQVPSRTDVTRGDFLVLTQTTQVPSAPSSPNFNITAITGYIYTDGTPADSGNGIFQKFTYAVPSAEQGNSLETILTAHKSTIAASLTTIATGLTATHSDNASSPSSPKNRAFMIRNALLSSGMLNLSVSTGYVGTRTNNEKLIETAFFIRN
jgi:hypothetical protein